MSNDRARGTFVSFGSPVKVTGRKGIITVHPPAPRAHLWCELVLMWHYLSKWCPTWCLTESTEPYISNYPQVTALHLSNGSWETNWMTDSLILITVLPCLTCTIVCLLRGYLKKLVYSWKPSLHHAWHGFEGHINRLRIPFWFFDGYSNQWTSWTRKFRPSPETQFNHRIHWWSDDGHSGVGAATDNGQQRWTLTKIVAFFRGVEVFCSLQIGQGWILPANSPDLDLPEMKSRGIIILVANKNNYNTGNLRWKFNFV